MHDPQKLWPAGQPDDELDEEDEVLDAEVADDAEVAEEAVDDAEVVLDVDEVEADVADDAVDAVEAADVDEVVGVEPVQLPAVQARPGLHALSQRPQCAESFALFTQTAPHLVSGSTHDCTPFVALQPATMRQKRPALTTRVIMNEDPNPLRTKRPSA